MIYNPGLVNYDTVNQVLDFMDGVSAVPFGYVGGQEEVVVQYNAHHPVFVTLIFGTFIKIGVILGNPSVGLFMYIIVQMILAAIIFSFAIKYSSELVGNSESVSIALVAFFCAVSCNPILCLHNAKEFIAFFVVCVVCIGLSENDVKTRGIVC